MNIGGNLVINSWWLPVLVLNRGALKVDDWFVSNEKSVYFAPPSNGRFFKTVIKGLCVVKVYLKRRSVIYLAEYQ